MYRQVLSLSLAALGAVFAPASASADPLRLNFEGTWAFYDPYDQQPDFWQAMGAAGVFLGAPLTYSVIVSGIDNDPTPLTGSYAVLASNLRVGSLRQTTAPASLTVGAGYGLTTSTAWLGAPVGSYAPSYMQLSNYGAALPSDQLSDLYPYLNSGGTLLYIGYAGGGCSLCMGVSLVTLKSIESVPEPRSLLLIATGLLALLSRGALASFITRRARRHTVRS